MKLLMSLLEAVLLLTGAGSPEELSESEFERFESLSAHPVCINIASPGKLRSCGLFSDYQIASLQDYRMRTGDILSLTELGAVPGFTPELVSALSWFISLESYAPAGSREKKRIRQEVAVRMVSKKDSRSYAGKYHVEAGERAELFLSRKDASTVSLTLYGRRPWKLIAGDYNLRLGQGLLAWDGFILSGYPSLASFCHNASGFSGTGSFTPGRRGLAAAFEGRNMQFGAGVDLDGNMSGMLVWLGKTGSLGLNVQYGGAKKGISLDWKKSFGHLSTFGEAAYSGSPSALAGFVWEPVYKVAAGILARYRPLEDDAGLAAGVRWRWFSWTADLTLHPEKWRLRKNNYEQLKTILDLTPEFERGSWTLRPSIRCTERMRLSPSENAFTMEWRHDLRCDLKASRKWLQTTLRLNGVQTGDYRPGVLAYLEIGYKTPSDTSRLQISAFLRGTVCDIANWSSRIYAYERDLPGSFNVPAWYGQTTGVSLVAGVAFRSRKCRQRLNLRLSTKDFKLQYSYESFARKK